MFLSHASRIIVIYSTQALIVLDLEDNLIGTQGAQYFADALQQNGVMLQSLHSIAQSLFSIDTHETLSRKQSNW
jgi:Ran GTPase-activating protein (RanGAP) involved in mRNA processing and transport